MKVFTGSQVRGRPSSDGSGRKGRVGSVERRLPGFIRIWPYDPSSCFGMLLLLNQCPNFHKKDHARLGVQVAHFVVQPPAGLDFELSFQNFCSVVTGDKDLFACFFLREPQKLFRYLIWTLTWEFKAPNLFFPQSPAAH